MSRRNYHIPYSRSYLSDTNRVKFHQRLFYYPRYKKQGWLKWIPSFRLCAWLLFFGTFTILLIFSIAYYTIQIPPLNNNSFKQSITYYYSDKTEIGRAGINRINVNLDQVPKYALDSIIETENRTFYSDSGVSFKGIARAFYELIVNDRIVSGGSTISQQYVRNVYLNETKSFTRKFKEIIITLKIAHQVPKQDILQNYVNTIYFGRGANGIEAASRAYFGIHTNQLSLSQAVLLASFIRSPSYYSNLYHDTDIYNQVYNRWKYILNNMYQDKLITVEEKNNAQMPGFISNGDPINDYGSNLASVIQTYGSSNPDIQDSLDKLSSTGGEVYTTLDKHIMDYVYDGLKKGLFDTLNNTDRDNGVTGSLLASNPSDGSILGFGSLTQGDSAYNLSIPFRSKKQPGSSFKPIVLSAAIDKDPDTWTLDKTITGKNLFVAKFPNAPDYVVHNDSAESFDSITVRNAIAHSINSSFEYIATQIGNKTIADYAAKIGVNEKRAQSGIPNSSFAIGTSLFTQTDMLPLYNALANDGKVTKLYLIKEIDDPKHSKMYIARPNTTYTMKPVVVSRLIDALHAVTTIGTASLTLPKIFTQPSYGKTGTATDDKTAVFSGFTKDIAATALYYREVNEGGSVVEKSLDDVGGIHIFVGATAPARSWAYLMKDYYSNHPYNPITSPDVSTDTKISSSTSNKKDTPQTTDLELPTTSRTEIKKTTTDDTSTEETPTTTTVHTVTTTTTKT